MNPKYPIFIPSKGRAESRLTMKMFDKLQVPYTVVVEPQEYKHYKQYFDDSYLLKTPHENKGLTVTRNYIWDYAYRVGYDRFWTFDDNISSLYRLNRNWKVRVCDGTILKAAEDFVDRYENIAIAGMHYMFFCKATQGLPAFYLNTRVYSNMLIKTDLREKDGTPFRNKLYFNDDTDLCLRVLKDGYCTITFAAFLIDKKRTQTIKGGMTEIYNNTNNRKEFAEELIKAHPDVARLVFRFKRWHHYVDYRPFAENKLKPRDGLVIPEGVNNYGMKLIKVEP